jgi:MFS family permease
MAAEGVIAREGPRPLAFGVAVVPLLTLGVFIQYVDRGNLATAAPLMKSELGLSAAQMGVLLSAFYWSYAPSQPLAGWLAHRLNPYRTLALGLAIWSLATAATGLVSSFAALIVLRIMLGIGESAFFPCNAKLLAQHLPDGRLGGANGLIGLGMAVGPAFGTWGGGNLMAFTGWRASFLVLGVLSMLWLIPWRRATADLSRAVAAEPAAPAPSYVQIMRRWEAWGAAFGHFCANYAFYFLISWLPLYLVKQRGLSMTEMAGVAGLIYLLYGASCVAGGRLADRWMRSGASANRVRKSLLVASHVVFGASLIGAAAGDARVSIACLFAAAVGFGLNTPSLLAVAQTLAGPRAGGKWMGFQNAVGNIAGIIGPVITGVAIDMTGNYALAFVLAGGMAFLGVIGWGIMIRKVAPLEWS